MPGSLAYEEKVLNQILKKEAFTATKTYLCLTTLKPSELTKKTTGLQVGEKEPTEANGWLRVEMDELEWTVTKAEGETGFTIYENKNAIKGGGGAGEFKKLTAGEYLLETWAVCEKPKQTEVGPVLVFGKLTTKVTVNSASTLEVAAKELKIELE